MIELKDVTLKYSSTKGIFNLNFSVEKGQVFGYVGPNDAGKTTTIRMLMGLIRAGRGSATIDGLNCFSRASAIQKNTGYVPEDVALFENMRVKEYLNFVTQMRGIFGQKNTRLRDMLIERFEVETRGKIENMSNGMKKRLAIVTALMHDPQTLVLDEPTSGLDPLMQSRFLDLILEEKRRGKTVLLSTHKFEEVERTCDRVGVLREGRLVENMDIVSLRAEETKAYLVKFAAPPNLEQIKKYGFGYQQFSQSDYEIFSPGDRIDVLMKVLSHEKVLVFNSKNQSLEEIFQQHYKKEIKQTEFKNEENNTQENEGKIKRSERKPKLMPKKTEKNRTLPDPEETVREVKKA
ncbi:ABC transporter ATP-binding protein [Acetobacterium wieringae]|uniref:ABC transporter ATP-binding protein n=1 Tax=Acetobacterium wieringae TaxID=52694 RepID=A0ABY6HIT2_9FIRM|nr:ABC transporter ATP-binding protein [Acetobacterium wieringae]UYO64200.1 ABC transporter ATP-binding protein [Acetobacterium wieringae]VUZ23472.1 Vitamin B12 import ATP-binding protein BtuD [Acetobacterium wieringae]